MAGGQQERIPECAAQNTCIGIAQNGVAKVAGNSWFVLRNSLFGKRLEEKDCGERSGSKEAMSCKCLLLSHLQTEAVGRSDMAVCK